MRLTKKASAALLLAALTIGILGIDASALTPVTKATKVAVVTTPTTATITWTAFAKGKVTGIKIIAANGSKKITKSIPATSKSFKFTGLYPNSSYVFSVYGVKGTSTSAAVIVRAKTKVLMYENTTFFDQPDDMFIGAANQELFALSNGGKTSFSTSTPTVCEVVKVANASYLKAIAAGDCTVTARNPGDKQYKAARNVVRNLLVSVPMGSFEKTLLWEENFDGAAGAGPSTDNWVIETGDGCPDLCGWGNDEKQAYAACAIKQDGNGFMRITASKGAAEPDCITDTPFRNYTSGKFTTFGKKHFTYGYFEARMKMPVGGGTWPAFWTLGSNIKTLPWPASGELDIMEYAGNSPRNSTSAGHYEQINPATEPPYHEYKSGFQTHDTALSSDFNTYGMLWTPSKVSFYFNGEIFWILKKSDTGLDKWPFGPSAAGVHPKMYLILNLAMGGNYGGTIKSNFTKATFEIDYVRYYSIDGYGTAPTSN